MLEFMVTLLKGKAARVEEAVAEKHALMILEQQVREAAAEVERSRKALALAIAQDEGEAKRAARIEARIKDLEDRAVAALGGGRDDLAKEAAEAIAGLESDLGAIRESRTGFSGELAKLRVSVSEAIRRLSALDRGRRMAEANETIARLRSVRVRTGAPSIGALAEAEATLTKLRARQLEDSLADSALAELDTTCRPQNVSEKLEAAGFGPSTRVSSSDVLERLRKRTRPERSET